MEHKVIATKTLPLDVIRIDGGTQVREKLTNEWVDQLAQLMQGGVTLPPCIAFFDGSDYWLVDGFHRYHATKKINGSDIKCDVINGTINDAIIFSYSVNSRHGLTLTNADKRKIIYSALKNPDIKDKSLREIAKICGNISYVFVSKVKSELNQQKPAKTPVNKDVPKEDEVHESDARDEEIAKMREQIDLLAEENDKLTFQLAIGSSDDPEFANKTIEELREEVKQLRIENKSLIISRDQFQAENAQLIKQVNYLTKKLKQTAAA